MKTTYESCGKIDVANKTITVNTYLPDKPELNFRYIHFYNISSSSHYGVLGILVNDGRNTDQSNETPILTTLPGLINLSTIDYIFSKVTFNDLEEQNQIGFICFHDDEFDTKNPGVVEFRILKYWQDKLPLYADPRANSLFYTDEEIQKAPDGDGEPKVGNGGVLTITGC